MIISLISQKGGVGKSALARVLAVEFVRAGWSAKIADLDPAQGTSTKWGLRRDQNAIDPEIPVSKYRDPSRAIRDAERCDLLILDGPAHSERSGLVMASASDMVLIPTGYSVDDLEPQIQLAYDLEAAKVPADRIRLVFCRARGSAREDDIARDFVRRAKLRALKSAMRELPCVRQSHAMGKSASETGYKSIDAEAKALAAEVAAFLKRRGG